MQPIDATIADSYRRTAADARRIARDPKVSPEMRAAARATAETNDRLFASYAAQCAREGKRLPRGTVRVAL